MAPAPSPIKQLFAATLRECFVDLDLEDEGIVDYLADLLARFADVGAFYPRGAAGERLETIADRVREIQRAWDVGGPHFDPAREVDLQRDLGDHALFMSGFLWERVKAMSARRHYLRMGRRAYRFVAAYHRANRRPEARRFARLATRFETYAAVVSYMRDVHLDADYTTGTPRTPPRFTIP